MSAFDDLIPKSENATAFDDLVPAPKVDLDAPVGSEGFMGGIADAARGVARYVVSGAPEQFGKAAQFFGAERVGKSLEDFGKAQGVAHPELKHSIIGQREREDSLFSARGAAYEAGSNTPLSVGPGLAGAAIGAGIGSVVPGIGTGIGAAGGFLAGSLAALPIFYGSQAQETKEKVEKAQLAAGAAPEAAASAARTAGHLTGSVEAGGELVADLIPFGKLLKPFAKPVAGALVKGLFGGGIKDAVGTMGKVVGGEVATEMAQGASQQAIEGAYGAGEGATWKDTAAVIMPTALMSLLPGGFTVAHNYRSRANLRNALTDVETPPEQRVAAAATVFSGIEDKDPALAVAFEKYARDQILAGKPIEIGEDALYERHAADAAKAATADSGVLTVPPAAPPPTPAEKAGIDANAGPASAAAAAAINTGLANAVAAQRQQPIDDAALTRREEELRAEDPEADDAAIASQIAAEQPGDEPARGPMFPYKTLEAAQARADAQTKRGVPSSVMPHPIKSGHFAVTEDVGPATRRAQQQADYEAARAKRKAEKEAARAEKAAQQEKANAASKPAEEAAPTVRPSENVGDDPQDAARPREGADAEEAAVAALAAQRIEEERVPAQRARQREVDRTLRERLMGMSRADLDAAATAAHEHNDKTDAEIVREVLGEDAAKEFASKSAIGRRKWWEQNATEQMDDLADERGQDADTIGEYRDAAIDFDTESPEYLGRSILQAVKKADSTDFANSPAALTIRNAIAYAKEKGWDLDEVTRAARGRARELYGDDAPELVERLFRSSTGTPTKRPATVLAPDGDLFPSEDALRQGLRARGLQEADYDLKREHAHGWLAHRRDNVALMDHGDNIERDEKRVDVPLKVPRTIEGTATRVDEVKALQAPANADEETGVATQLYVQYGGRRYPVSSLDEASEKWDTFRAASSAGASELDRATVVDADGKEVAVIAYNGRLIPSDAQPAANVDAAAHEAASSPTNDLPEPTAAQALAGNYKKGHTRVGALDISIENPEGSTRSDKENTPPKWSTTIAKAHYGYIRGTLGRDKDHVDAFVKPGTAEDHDGPVFVIDQVGKDGKFDEHKVMLGYASQLEAVGAYKANYPKGHKVGTVTETTMRDFETWARDTHLTSKPFAERAQATAAALANEDNDRQEPVPTTTVVDGKLHTDLPTVQHVTTKGKTLTGVVWKAPSLFAAKAIDKFTFKKDDGYFIREQHVVRDAAPTTEPETTKTEKVQPAAETTAAPVTKPVTPQVAAPVGFAPLGAKAKPAYGGSNKVFTADAADKARELLRKKFGQVSAGIDPEILQAGLTLAGYHIEAGARAWASYAKAMLDDLGEAARPYLRSWYEAVRHYPGFDTEGMTAGDAIAAEPAPGAKRQADLPGVTDEPTIANEAPHGTDSQPAPSREDDPASDAGQRPGNVREPVSGRKARRGGAGTGGAVRVADERGDERRDGQDEPAAGGPGGSGKGRGSIPARGDGERAGNGARVPARRKPSLPDGVADYHPEPGTIERRGSWREQAKTNLDAIELVKKLEAEARWATPEEQATLAKWTGWGASDLAQNLFPGYRFGDGQFRFDVDRAKPEWRALAERVEALMTSEEIQAAARSTQYAHYTSETVIRAMWSGLERMGFKGGRIMEPGMGTGLFPVLAPAEAMRNSAYTGIEFEPFTAKIAKYLLPEQTVVNTDFTRHPLPKGFFDLAIGNPPFARTKILADPEYKRLRFSLHDYFFAKTIDRVRPGGVMAFVTSRYTMDKAGQAARQYIADRADLVAAFRLPRTAFMQNAGTEVVTDILIFQRRPEGQPASGVQWLNQEEVTSIEGEKYLINEYFVAHPKHVLGQHSNTGKMRAGNEYTVLPAERAESFEQQLATAMGLLPEGIITAPISAPTEHKTFERDMSPTAEKEGQVYVAADGEVYIRENGTGVRLEERRKLSANDKTWFKGYVSVRNAMKQARMDQLTEGDWKKSLAALNKAYDAFVKENGPLLTFTDHETVETDDDGTERTIVKRRYKNESKFRQDVEGPLVMSLEQIDNNGDIQKGKFLRERVLARPESPTITNAQDALAVSLSDRGRLDIPHIAELAGISADDVIADLGDAIYFNPGASWETADAYLSGNVRQKLAEARAAAEVDPAFERNVQALIKAQPLALSAKDITVGLGSPWIPAEYLNSFASDVVGLASPEIQHNELLGMWTGLDGAGVQRGRGGTSEWATEYRSPAEILDAALNAKTIKVTRTYKDGGTTRTETLPEASAAANEKVKQMREKFAGWIWTDSQRAANLIELYNDRFNNIAPREFDGTHLRLPGLSLRYKLFDHQKRAIWRQVQNGNTYLAHAVGAGKTLEMIVGGMEQKRLGLINLPMYVVPNHMLNQFAAEFLDAYPAADIMVADETNFHTHNRRRFVAQAAMNKPDAIVITHSAFGLVKPDPAASEIVLQRLIGEMEAAMAELGKDQAANRTRKKIEQRIEQIEQRFASKTGQGDDVLTFTEMGVDMLYVDEAHEFRKLDFVTNRTVKGITPEGSKRALDLYIKIKSLEAKRPGRTHVMASGTPVTNTLAELYTIQRYMDEDALEADGFRAFDSWAAQFGEVESFDERNAAGTYEVVERFAKFVNVPELMSRVRSFMDVLTSNQLKHLVKVPTMIGDGPQVVVTENYPELKGYMGMLADRIAKSRKWKPSKAEPNNPDPLINIITDARLAAIDSGFVTGESNPASKLNKMVDEIIRVQQEAKGTIYTDPATGKADPIKGGTQIVFSAVGFGDAVARNRGFDLRGHVNKRLVKGGFKPDELAWISDYNSHAKKEGLFRAMREGKVKVLFGSPKNMGTGVNVQKRLIHEHFLSPPWYPADEEQPRGRIIRQGNQNDIVGVSWYATKETYDSTQWQMISRKARFIDSAMTGGKDLRKVEDVSEASQYEQASALASGDERVIQFTRLKRDIDNLNLLMRAHSDDQFRKQGQLRFAESAAKRTADEVAELKAMIAAGAGKYLSSSDIDATVRGEKVKGAKEFGTALLKEAQRARAVTPPKNPEQVISVKFGTMNGAEVVGALRMFKYGKEEPSFKVSLQLRYGTHETKDLKEIDPDEPMTDGQLVGLGTAIAGGSYGVQTDLNAAQRKREGYLEQAAALRKQLGAPFERMQELADKVAEAARLREELLATNNAVPADEAEAMADAIAADRWEDEGGRLEADGLAPSASIDTGGLGLTGAGGVDVTPLVRSLRQYWGIDFPDGALIYAEKLPRGAAALRAMTAHFGVKIEFFENLRPDLISFKGMALDGQRTIYLRADSKTPHLTVAGHELLHVLRSQYPEVYAELVAALRPLLRESAMGDYVRRLGMAHAKRIGRMERIEEELIADLVGDNFTNPTFWARLARQDPTRFQRIAQAVLDFIRDVIRALRRDSFQSRDYIRDLEAAQAAIAKAMGQFAARSTPQQARAQPAFRAAAAFSRFNLRPDPVWRSALADAFQNATKLGVMPGHQWKAWLANNAGKMGVKKDEIEWSGINDWLDTRTAKVSKEEVQAFLDQNGVRVEEVELNDRGRHAAALTIEDVNELNELLSRPGASMSVADRARMNELISRANDDASSEGGGAKFGSYQLPGGQNYRELLLTLPQRRRVVDVRTWERAYNDGVISGAKWRRGLGDQSLRVLGEEVPSFRSTHFDQPNILAHVRFNERTDAEGRRVLFLEEVQSDWAQKGRKEGFGDTMRYSVRDANGHMRGDFATREEAQAYLDKPPEHMRHLFDHTASVREAPAKGTPAAPFVGKTEAWVALALKRMIRYAADNGFDAVAWTAGEQQADRYDLSKQIESVEYRVRVDGGAGHLTAFDKSGDRVLSQNDVKPADLHDYIGKEAADRLLQNEGPGIYQSSDKVYVLTGEQLKVGGEGMRAFYDKIVPNVANDILKKIGGGRVGEVRLGADEANANLANDSPAHAVAIGVKTVQGFTITPQMRAEAARGMSMFSLDTGAPMASIETPSLAERATQLAGDLFRSPRQFNSVLKHFQTQYHKAQTNSWFRPVFNAAQNYVKDTSRFATEAADEALDLLPKLGTVGDWFKRGPKDADVRAAGHAMFAATLADVRPSNAELAAGMSLQSPFGPIDVPPLTADQIRWFNQARASIDTSLRAVAASEMVKLARGEGIDAALTLATRNTDQAHGIIVAALRSLAPDNESAVAARDALIKKIDDVHGRVEALLAKGYAPLQRFGTYTVHVTKMVDGERQQLYFGMYESRLAMNRAAREFAQDPEFAGATVTTGVMDRESYKLFQGLALDELATYAEVTGMDQDEAFQDYYKLALSNNSALKRLIHRKGIAGYDEDLRRVLASFVTSNARLAARNIHFGEILGAATRIPAEHGDVRTEAARLVQYMRNPTEEAASFRGLLFVNFIGGSVASALVNMTQPVMMTLPFLSQFTNPAKALGLLTAAAKYAGGAVPTDAALRAAMERASKEGITDPQELHQLYAESIRGLGSSLAWRKALSVWGKPFSWAESWNRQITFAAAFQMAHGDPAALARANELRAARGLPAYADAFAFAAGAVEDTQGIYNRANRPNLARGAIGATVFTFKQFSIAYLEFLSRLPAREKALTGALLFLATGLQGMPGADDLEDLIDTIGQMMGYNTNTKQALRRGAAHILGESMGGFVAHGISGIPGVPLDIQARMSLGNLIPGSGLFKRSETSKEREIAEAIGPAGGIYTQAMAGFNAIVAGNPGAAIGQAAPVALRNLAQGVTMWNTGQYRDSYGRKVMDVDGLDAAFKAIGFQPQQVAETQRRASDVQQDVAMARKVETEIADRWARGIMDKDPAAVKKAITDLFQWNQRNPDSRIAITPAQVRQRVQQALMGREARLMKAAPRELRSGVFEALRNP